MGLLRAIYLPKDQATQIEQTTIGFNSGENAPKIIDYTDEKIQEIAGKLINNEEYKFKSLKDVNGVISLIKYIHYRCAFSVAKSAVRELLNDMRAYKFQALNIRIDELNRDTKSDEVLIKGISNTKKQSALPFSVYSRLDLELVLLANRVSKLMGKEFDTTSQGSWKSKELRMTKFVNDNLKEVKRNAVNYKDNQGLKKINDTIGRLKSSLHFEGRNEFEKEIFSNWQALVNVQKNGSVNHF